MMTATIQDVVLATSNAGKIRELSAPMAAMGVRLLGLADFPDLPPVEENGATFAQNALIKARQVAKLTHLIAVADDSGLEVEALHGRPGVHSARYADDWPLLEGENRDQRNMRKLLFEMEGLPESRRGCRFVTCMAAVRPDGRELTVEAHWEGRILTAPMGNNGFGYDPLFFDPEIGTTAAMLTSEQKTSRSHRGKAVRGLLARWQHFLNLPNL
ncbi:MAG: RdgB/HAM1 family non-canonical purine NTP pyrophosphatase [Desulfovibrio sp.]|nr:RdgB/HAM1 family non-canonical purine NTP pyrophosphatase [Desulfovibrio sp.]